MPVTPVARLGVLGAMAGRLASSTQAAAELPPLHLLSEVRGMVASLPLLGLPEQLLARGYVAHLLAHVTVPLTRHPDLVAMFLAMAASPWDGDEWYVTFVRLVDRLEAVLRNENPLGPGHGSLEARVARAERYIETHYADPALSLRRVADQVGLSVSYLGRTIRERTGEGFVAHVRRHRVAAARRLLEDTVMSVKEIAGAVGYRTPRQLERDFQRSFGTAPKSIRSRVALPLPDTSPRAESSA